MEKKIFTKRYSKVSVLFTPFYFGVTIILLSVFFAAQTNAQSVNVGDGVTINVSSGYYLTAGGAITIAGPAGAIDNSGTIKLGGDWTNNGSGLINNSPGTVEFNGSSLQTITGTNSTTFHHLKINNASDVALGNNENLDGTLTFTSGRVNTSSNVLTVNNPANAIAGADATKFVNGNLQATFPPSTGQQSFKYEMGDATVYAPATIDIRNVNSGSVNITGYTAPTDANESIGGGSGIDQTKKANRYWFMNKSGAIFNDYDITLDFTNCSPTGNIPNYIMKKFDPSLWAATNATVTGNTIKATGLSSFSDFETGEPAQTALNLSMYLEGYYVGSGFMRPAMKNQAATTNPTRTDSVFVTLHNTTSPYAMTDSAVAFLSTNGTTSAIFPPTVAGNSRYIQIRHRNSIQTWSAAPLAFTSSTSYDFTTGAGQAYGNNLVQVDNSLNKWALYSGNLNLPQDQNIDLIDFPILDFGINNGLFGYYRSDLNGDGNVDIIDFPVLDANINAGIFSRHP